MTEARRPFETIMVSNHLTLLRSGTNNVILGGIAGPRYPRTQNPSAQPPPAAYPHHNRSNPLNNSDRKPNPYYAAQVGLAGARTPPFQNPWAQPPPAEYLRPNRSNLMNDLDTRSRTPSGGFGQSLPGQMALYSVQAARATTQAYNTYTAESRPQGQSYHPIFNPTANTYTAQSEPQRQSYHPVFNPTAMAHPPAINTAAIAPRFRSTTPLPHQQILVVSSLLGYDPKGIDASGNVRERKTLNQVVFAAVASPDACMICKVPFGQENSHGAYFENVRQPDGDTVRVEINNLGAVETRVFLPCGHDVGNNCIIPHNFCPRCRASLQYPDCPHHISLTTVKTNRKDAEKKCVECRVLDLEHKENLSGLLAELRKLKEGQATLDKEMREHHAFDRNRLRLAIINTQQKVQAIKAQTDLMIQDAHFQLSGYNG